MAKWAMVPNIALLAGLFTIVAAIADWDWFFENSRAKPFVKWFGRDGARIFYVGLGALIALLAGVVCR